MRTFQEITTAVTAIATSLHIEATRTYGHADISETMTGQELIAGTAQQAFDMDMTDEQITADLLSWEEDSTRFFMYPVSGEVVTRQEVIEDMLCWTRLEDPSDPDSVYHPYTADHIASMSDTAIDAAIWKEGVLEVRHTETEEEQDLYGEWMAV